MQKLWVLAFACCAAWAQNDDADIAAIRDVAGIYISADAARLPMAFSSTANLYTTDDKGGLRIIPVAEYIDRVRKNTPPPDRHASIEHIDRSGNAATVTVVTLTPTNRVTDYLAMLRLEGAWKIVAKTFSVEPRAASAAVCGNHTFDYMIGNWDTADSPSEGTSTVEAMLGGCVVHEHRRVFQQGKRLFDGDAYWSYDSTTKRWLLLYLDDQSHAQVYEGREEAGRIGFYRERPDADGKTVLIRIVYQAVNGGYTQAVERSADKGATWQSGGVTTYRPKK